MVLLCVAICLHGVARGAPIDQCGVALCCNMFVWCCSCCSYRPVWCCSVLLCVCMVLILLPCLTIGVALCCNVLVWCCSVFYTKNVAEKLLVT